MSDYPFNDFYDFMCAYTEMLSTEYFGEEYPKFEKALDRDGGLCKKIVVRFIKKLETNPEDPDGIRSQDAINKIVDCYLNDGQRYARDFIIGGCEIIDYLLRKGAEFPTSSLFCGPDNADWMIDEFESNYFDVAATLLDHYGPKLNLDISSYADWANIEACHWEEIPEDEFNELDDGPESDKDMARMGYLKYLSDYIQEKYPKVAVTEEPKTEGEKTEGEKTEGEKTEGEKTEGEKAEGEKAEEK